MPHDPLTLFLSGMVAIVAMILPGISGSFILLILGQYDHILNAVKSLDIVTIFPVGVGAVVGLMGFSRILSWLLQKYEQATIATLVGFMIGSLWKIWPWKDVLQTHVDRHGEVVPLVERNILPNFASSEFLIAFVLCVAGFLLVCFIDHLQSHSNPVFRLFKPGRRSFASSQ
jgi:putative membrane protein